MITFEGPQCIVDKSSKKILAWGRPPTLSGNARSLGTFWAPTGPLSKLRSIMTTFLSLLCLAKNVSEKLLLSRWNLRTLSPPSSTSPSLAPRWRASSYSTTWLRIQLCSRFQIKCRSFSASFSSQGRGADQGGDYQFDIYRSMKQHNQVLIVWMQTFCRQWR